MFSFITLLVIGAIMPRGSDILLVQGIDRTATKILYFAADINSGISKEDIIDPNFKAHTVDDIRGLIIIRPLLIKLLKQHIDYDAYKAKGRVAESYDSDEEGQLDHEQVRYEIAKALSDATKQHTTQSLDNKVHRFRSDFFEQEILYAPFVNQLKIIASKYNIAKKTGAKHSPTRPASPPHFFSSEISNNPESSNPLQQLDYKGIYGEEIKAVITALGQLQNCTKRKDLAGIRKATEAFQNAYHNIGNELQIPDNDQDHSHETKIPTSS
jgi:hypothetical protein